MVGNNEKERVTKNYTHCLKVLGRVFSGSVTRCDPISVIPDRPDPVWSCDQNDRPTTTSGLSHNRPIYPINYQRYICFIDRFADPAVPLPVRHVEGHASLFFCPVLYFFPPSLSLIHPLFSITTFRFSRSISHSFALSFRPSSSSLCRVPTTFIIMWGRMQ